MGFRGLVWQCALGLACLFAGGCPGSSDPVVETSPVPDDETGRWMPLDGPLNTRDIGGYVTAEDAPFAADSCTARASFPR